MLGDPQDRQFQELARAHNLLAEAFQKSNATALAEKERQTGEAFIAQAITIGAALYDKGASYTALIMSVGYVGLFTLWSNSKAFLAPQVNATVGFLIAISVIVFVLNEVFNMWVRQKETLEIGKILEAGPANFKESHAKYKLHIDRQKIIIANAYPFLFWITTLSGAAAGLILLISNLIAMTQ